MARKKITIEVEDVNLAYSVKDMKDGTAGILNEKKELVGTIPVGEIDVVVDGLLHCQWVIQRNHTN